MATKAKQTGATAIEAAGERRVETRGRKKGQPNLHSPVIGSNGIRQQPGDNSRYAMYLMEFLSWGPVDKNNIEAMEERFQKYLDYCAEHDMRISNQACYMAIGITKDDVFDWEHGKRRGSDPRYANFIKKVKQICATNREFLMNDNRLNPLTGIWWQKQYEGMRDQTELVVTPNQPLGPAPDEKQLAADYLNALPPADEA